MKGREWKFGSWEGSAAPSHLLRGLGSLGRVSSPLPPAPQQGPERSPAD